MQDTFQPCQTKGKEMLISMCQTGLLKGSSWYMCKIRLTSIIASWTELHEGKKQAEHIFFGSFTAVGQWVGPKYQTWLHIRLYIAIASNAGQHGHPCLLSARKHLTLACPIQRAMHQIPKSYARFSYPASTTWLPTERH